MKKKGYYLAIEKGRGLVSFSANTIHFNVSNFLLFDTEIEAKFFREKNKYHFFGLETLDILYYESN